MTNVSKKVAIITALKKYSKVFGSGELSKIRSLHWTHNFDLICILFLGPGLPNALAFHSMVQNDESSLAVLGGNSPINGYINEIYEISCRRSSCEWKIKAPKLSVPRSEFVALSVPGEFTNCEWTWIKAEIKVFL